VHPPNSVEQVIAAEDAARVAGKIIKQPEFGRGGGRQFPSHPQCMALASMTTSSKLMMDGAVGRSKRRSTAFTLATSSRVANGLVM